MESEESGAASLRQCHDSKRKVEAAQNQRAVVHIKRFKVQRPIVLLWNLCGYSSEQLHRLTSSNVMDTFSFIITGALCEDVPSFFSF